jgi:hypothetical protein
LNAFDHELMRLGQLFGNRLAFANRIAAFVEANPVLAASVVQARSRMTDQQRLDWLVSQLTVRTWATVREEIAVWPEPYRQLFLLDSFNLEMLNGGVHQFFFNSAGDLAPETINALRDAGLPRHADAVQRSLDMFAKPYITDTQARRQRYSSKSWSEWDDRLNAATDNVDDAEIGAKMMEIAIHHRLLPY